LTIQSGKNLSTRMLLVTTKFEAMERM